MTDKVNNAVEMFKEGYVCSQAVFAAFSEIYGLEKDFALKIGNAFGGGIARRQEVCGAVSGAIMLISLKCGKIQAGDVESHENTYKNVNDFCKKFIERNNSINCYELLGCDMAAAKEKGFFSTKCSKYVRDAAELIEELVEESKV